MLNNPTRLNKNTNQLNNKFWGPDYRQVLNHYSIANLALVIQRAISPHIKYIKIDNIHIYKMFEIYNKQTYMGTMGTHGGPCGPWGLAPLWARRAAPRPPGHTASPRPHGLQ